MQNQAVGRRYASALFDLAQEKGVLDQVLGELELVARMIEGDRYLYAVMQDVLISPSHKHNLVERLFGGKVSPLVLNFLFVVVRKRREGHILEIFRVFQDLANEARGVVEVEIRSAIDLPEATVRNLEEKLVGRLGKRVKFKTQVAPELIGGLVVRVGDTLMDGSIRSRLRRMRDRLISAQAE